MVGCASNISTSMTDRPVVCAAYNGYHKLEEMSKLLHQGKRLSAAQHAAQHRLSARSDLKSVQWCCMALCVCSALLLNRCC